MNSHIKFDILNAYDRSVLELTSFGTGMETDINAWNQSQVSIDNAGLRNVQAYDDSFVRLHDSYVGQVHAFNNAVVELDKSRGIGQHDAAVKIHDSAQLNVRDHVAASVEAYDNAKVSIADYSYLPNLVLHHNSTLDSTGSFHDISAYDNTIANLTGSGTYINAHDNTVINLDNFNVMGHLAGRDKAAINITNGFYGSVSLTDEAGINVYSGHIASRLPAQAAGTISIFGGYLSDVIAEDNSTINVHAGEIRELASAKNSQAEINISGGEITFLRMYGQDTINVSGGKIHSAGESGLTNNTYNMSGGNLGTARLQDANFNITDGIIDFLSIATTGTYQTDVTIAGGTLNRVAIGSDANINVSGGHIGLMHAWLNPRGRIELTDGQISTLRARLALEADQHLDYSAPFTLDQLGQYGVTAAQGVIDTIVPVLYTTDNSTALLSGGPMIDISARDHSEITLLGYDFQADQTLEILADGAVIGTGILTGKWLDGTAFEVSIIANDTTATIMAIPEPTTVALFSLAGAMALIKRRRLSS